MNPQSQLLGKKPANSSAHGGGVRGATLPRQSPQFEGRFGRIFRALSPADFTLSDLQLLAAEGAMTSPPELSKTGRHPAAAQEDPKTKFHDAEENSGVDAGYTYFGQFIDHDITFDPASSLQKQNDPDGLIDFRTPRLDLDCLYGRGPDDQPYMYASDGKHLLLGRQLFEGKQARSRDLPRHEWSENAQGHQQFSGPPTQTRALIGDKRNDENVIVSQLQSAMLHFHNRLVDAHPLASFAEIQEKVRWHYQYAVLHDYLPRIVGREMVYSILPHLKVNGSIFEHQPALRFYHPKEDLFIPVEFAMAAYRFGHSMVRPIYRLNKTLEVFDPDPKVRKQEEADGLAGRLFIFAGIRDRGLNGFGAFPDQWAIDWSLFFDINGSGKNVGKARVQPAYKIDASLVNPLAFLPEFSITDAQPPLTLHTLQAKPKPQAIANLALRNLERGLFMGLPSGQDIARAMGEVPLSDAELFVGKATYDEAFVSKTNQQITKIKGISTDIAGKTPLWCYVLSESLACWMKEVKAQNKKDDEADRIPVHLGPVGGRIVAETLIGLLLGDSHSFLSQDPNWKPTIPVSGATLTVGDIIKYALNL